MYENMTYDFLLKRALARAKSKYDKREGSIIFDSVAPITFELAEAYIMAEVILKETFATTADREYLELRAAEYNIYPEPATYAVMKGQFSDAVPIGARFNYEAYNFTVTELINEEEHTYKLTAETAGVNSNTCIGDITPITNINLETARITEIITPGEDAEDTETFRVRYIAALKSKAYGGNGADYKEKALAQNGVGGVKVYRCWNGGGTVKVVVLTTQYTPPDDEMIESLQNIFDPGEEGKGYGIAPIGHVVTVAKAGATPLTITANITLKSGSVSAIQSEAESAIKEYLLSKAVEWTTQSDKEYLTIRGSYILMALLKVDGITDVSNITINGSTEPVKLATDAIATLQKLTLVEG